MARFMDTLFASETPAALQGGIEVHVAEYHHIDPDERSGGWRTATLLINFADQPDARITFSAVRHAFTAARCSTHVFAGVDSAARLRRQLEETPFDSLDAVIYTGEDSAVSTDALQEIVDALPEKVTGLVTLVGDDCLRWSLVRGIDGFVRGATKTSPATVVSVFLLMAALNAPHTLTCLDHEYVAASLGTAMQPAVLAEALWLRQECKLAYACNADALAVSQASSITAHLIAADLRLVEMAAMANALRADVSEDCDFTYQAPANALITPYLHRSVAFMTLICVAPANAEHGLSRQGQKKMARSC